MPELPEVETIRRDLQELLPGKVIEEARLLFPGLVKYPSPEDFAAGCRGRAVREVGRRGKYLFLHLTGDVSLIVHLRMTGRLLYHPQGMPPEKHTRGVFVFVGGDELHFHDVRKFGTMWLAGPPYSQVGGLTALGPEPLTGEFTAASLFAFLRKTKSPVKSFLLSQKAAAGVGNIYADEALHLAGIRPDRRADSLNMKEAEKLWQAIRQVLNQGIEARGTSRRDYLDAGGRAGSYQDCLKVYGRRGEPCSRCSCAIERIIITGRSTHFCPACQPPPSKRRP